jgi:PAS domain S-box-containing protein
MSEHDAPSRKSYKLPVAKLLVMLTATVFLEELLVMLILDRLPHLSKMAEFLLDAGLLTVLIFPALYFLVYRPMLRNITELKQTQENLHTVSVAFESKDPILITDVHANILRANKAFLKMSGYSPEELIGQNPRVFKTDRYGEEYYKRMWNQLLRNGSWSGESRIRDKYGNEFSLGMVITAVKNDQKEITHYVAIYNI